MYKCNNVSEYSQQHYEVSIFNVIIPFCRWGSLRHVEVNGWRNLPKVTWPARTESDCYAGLKETERCGIWPPNLEYTAVSSVLWIKRQVNMSIGMNQITMDLCMDWAWCLLSAWKTTGCRVNMHTSQRTVPGPYQALYMSLLLPTSVSASSSSSLWEVA